MKPPPLQAGGFWFDDQFLHVYNPIQYAGRGFGTSYLRVSTDRIQAKLQDYYAVIALVVPTLLLISYLLAVWFFYLALCWSYGGMTVGMRAWKIVLLADEGDVGWRHCGIRFVTALVSAAALGLGFFWSLLDPQRRCWHDIASGTGIYLVSDRPSQGQQRDQRHEA